MPRIPTDPIRVVVVGGGVAAAEAVLALDDLAGDRVATTLVAPNPALVLRALSVRTPFGVAPPPAVPLDDLLAEHGGVLRPGIATSVDTARRVVVCTAGDPVPYDQLVLAPGARPIPAFPDALTFDPPDTGAIAALVADLDEGRASSVAFVVPAGATWPLPLYELALMTAAHGAEGARRPEVHVVTPEAAPLEVFGAEAAVAVADLLARAGIAFHSAPEPHVAPGGRITLVAGEVLAVDRVVALPRLEGPRLSGVLADEHGFIVTDGEGHVHGAPLVWAVGDATDQPIKQGGLACQQADAVAVRIASLAGVHVPVGPPEHDLRGLLLTGVENRFLHRAIGGARSTVSAGPLWSPPAKVSGAYLGPYLERRGVTASRTPAATP
jgi:sulfide:quinone oxidoreductase